MDLVNKLVKRIPSAASLPSLNDLAQSKERLSPTWAFFRRRVRLKGNSSISIPLGAVLLFPCVVVVLILIVIVRHPDSPAAMLLPAGAPPAIRFVRSRGLPAPFTLWPDALLTWFVDTGRSARSMTRSL